MEDGHYYHDNRKGPHFLRSGIVFFGEHRADVSHRFFIFPVRGMFYGCRFMQPLKQHVGGSKKSYHPNKLQKIGSIARMLERVSQRAELLRRVRYRSSDDEDDICAICTDARRRAPRGGVRCSRRARSTCESNQSASRASAFLRRSVRASSKRVNS